MELPPRAASMYQVWWSFVQFAATARDEAGKFLYTVADASSAASSIAKSIGGQFASYNPIGVSQLFGVARRIANSTANIDGADNSAPITQSMVSEAPWSRSPADQAAGPLWQARVSMTYTDPAGVQQEGISVVTIPQVLPSTVGSLRAQLGLRIQDQLSSPPGTGTPRSGQLDSIDSITLLAV